MKHGGRVLSRLFQALQDDEVQVILSKWGLNANKAEGFDQSLRARGSLNKLCCPYRNTSKCEGQRKKRGARLIFIVFHFPHIK